MTVGGGGGGGVGLMFGDLLGVPFDVISLVFFFLCITICVLSPYVNVDTGQVKKTNESLSKY